MQICSKCPHEAHPGMVCAACFMFGPKDQIPCGMTKNSKKVKKVFKKK